MIKELKNLFVIALVFGSYNFFVFSQETLTFNTVTEALNYNGNKSTVTKLIITGTISGNDYSTSSEWSKFRTFNETFPNIEEMEILTDQNIPDYIATRGLFNNVNWLKKFSAPNVTNIGNRAFERCNNLILINFPLVTTIGSSAFYSCKNLTSVNFPLVTNIGKYAFEECESLTSVNSPLVTTIGDGAFAGCKSLTSVNFPLVTTIGDGALGGCSFTSVDFPLVTTIGAWVFNGSNLTSVDFPLVTTIGDNAFYDCKILTSVNIPLVTTIGKYLFYNCSSLTSINFPLVTTIGDSAFYNCENLITVNLPLVTTVGRRAFSGCKNLVSVSLGTGFETETEIKFGGSSVFYNVETENIDLVLGENVLPKPDLTAKTWQTRNGTETGTPYVWKSIKVTAICSLIVSTGTGGTVTGAGIYNLNDTAKLTAVADSGYKFVNWTNADTVISEDNPFIFVVTKDMTITANFIENDESIEEAIKNSTVNIYPNPTNSEAILSFELESACNMKILLCDVLGIELINVYDGFASEGTFTNKINTEHLPQGVYFIKIHINGNTITKKIIK